MSKFHGAVEASVRKAFAARIGAFAISGAASIGMLTGAAFAAPQVQISEVRIDQTGNDLDEYFELAGPPGTVLTGLTYLVIGDGPGGSGVIEAIVQLNGHVIGPSGFFVVAEPTFTLGIANFVVPGANGLNFENGDNVTHLLVGGFSGALNQDLDLNDDGMLDITPWAQVVDRVSLILQPNPPTTTEWHYGQPTVGPESTPNGPAVPGHVFRRPCDGAWQIGPFNPAIGVDSPGQSNPTGPGDIDANQSVDGADLAIVLGNWGMPGIGDLNNDGFTNGSDLAIVLGNWGPIPCEPVGTLYSMRMSAVPTIVQTNNGPIFTLARFEYDFVLGQLDVQSGQAAIITRGFKLLTEPLDSPGGPLGEFDLTRTPFAGEGGATVMLPGPMFAPLATRAHYRMIDAIQPPGESGEDGVTATEVWVGSIEGFATMADDGSIVVNGTLFFSPEVVIAGEISSLEIPLLNAEAKPKDFGLPNCPAERRCNKQRICIQPVFIGTGAADPNKTGRSLASQMTEADSIWAKACVEFDWKDPIYIDKPAYKDIEKYDQNAGRTERDNLRKEKDIADCIEVYFVSTFTKANGDAHADGDGVTVGGKTADAKVIVADAAVNSCNPASNRVLAHELGHAMGNCPHTANTCMKATGNSPNCPGLNPNTVSKAEIDAVRGSALSTSKIPKDPCCTDPS